MYTEFNFTDWLIYVTDVSPGFDFGLETDSARDTEGVELVRFEEEIRPVCWGLDSEKWKI